MFIFSCIDNVYIMYVLCNIKPILWYDITNDVHSVHVQALFTAQDECQVSDERFETKAFGLKLLE
jgi:hypothetical protein